MKKTRSILRAGAVVGVALAAGHLVQSMQEDRPVKVSGSEAPSNVVQVAAGVPQPGGMASGADIPPVAASVVSPAGLADAAPADPPLATETAAIESLSAADDGAQLVIADPVTAAEMAEALPELAALTDDLALPPVAPAPVLPAPALAARDCTPQLSLQAGAQAMISVSLSAPCDPGARVVLRHAGLAVAEKLGADGVLSIDIPALEAAGRVSVLLPGAEVAIASVDVPGVEKLRRFAVQWMADDAFQLHAMENGAGYDDPGHVSVESPVSPNGGYMVALGDPSLDLPMMATVYTWPPATTAHPVIEAEVTDLTCGRELLGETLMSEQGKVTVTDLTLAMPDCTATGDILVLNNLVPDMTLAAAD